MTKPTPLALAGLLIVGLVPNLGAQSRLANGGFEDGEVGQAPPGWFLPTAGFGAMLTDENPADGQKCARISRSGAAGGPATAPFGNLLQCLEATPWRGRRVRLRGQVRVEGRGAAALWLRVDRAHGTPGFFDNMGDRQIRDRTWKTYDIVGNVDADAEQICVGLMVFGGATAWLDAVRFEDLGAAVVADRPPRPLDGRGLENLVAATRLLGDLRYFHPSDEAAKADWESLALAVVDRAEPAASPEQLAAALRAVFEPVAPSLQVWAGAETAGPPAPKLPDRSAAPDIVGWHHYGLGTTTKKDLPGIYRSDLRRCSRAEDAARKGIPPEGTAVTKNLGGGVWARVPIVLCADQKGTLPRSQSPAPSPPPGRPEGWRPSAEDRSTRLATVALAWNVFQHFYPYFDVVATDWPEALRSALAKAAEDPDPRAFLDTLRELVAKLHDGHGRVAHASDGVETVLPLAFAWAGDELVVAAVADGVTGVHRGDVVLAIDGVPLATLVEREGRLISAATDAWRRYRLLGVLSTRRTADPAALTVRRRDGTEAEARVARAPAGAARLDVDRRPANGTELAAGVVYFNLDQASDKELAAALPKLEKATGIVFDLRGYPGDAGVTVLRHLTTEAITSAQWTIPVVLLPDREGLTFHRSPGWDVKPKKPHLDGRIVFVTDGRAISYAESCLGIVENYKLGEIVGEPTAGTNGNVNPFSLPGGYSISWTGMRVLKHDGSPHHGVGIKPTVPASRTPQGIADGRDELLEKAIEVAGGAKD